MSTVILADGAFPTHPEPLRRLSEAEQVVCCDGAALKLLDAGREPDWIAGDLDSLPPELKHRFAARLIHNPDQESNDLAKAFEFCRSRNRLRNLTILGGTGLREDHTLGNIALLADFAKAAPEIAMVTDCGDFAVALGSGDFAARPGQQISLFSFDPAMAISSYGLKYPLRKLQLRTWWQAALNEATGTTFRLEFSGSSPVLIYRAF